MLCEMMKWNHLPVDGGIYDQDPEMLDGFLTIFHERSQYEAAEAKKRERESGKRAPRTPVAGRRRR